MSGLRLEGFEDVSTLLRSGVYVLCRKGVVIYVGKAKGIYSRIYTHKNFANRAAKGLKLPSWLPVTGLQFDQVFIRYVHVDQLDAVEAEMVNRYKPHYNTNLKNGLKVGPISVTINGVVIQTNAAPRPQSGMSLRR